MVVFHPAIISLHGVLRIIQIPLRGLPEGQFQAGSHQAAWLFLLMKTTYIDMQLMLLMVVVQIFP